jgi:hypothetical protein
MLKTPRYGYTEFINLKTGETETTMLYDHDIDPDENVNVVANPQYKPVVDSLHRILHQKFKRNIKGI